MDTFIAPCLAYESVGILNCQYPKDFTAINRGRHNVTNVGVRGVLFSVRPRTIGSFQSCCLVLNQHGLKIQIIAVVSDTGWRLLEILWAVRGELALILRAEKVHIYYAEGWDLPHLETAGYGASLVPIAVRGEVRANAHDSVLFVHACIGVP